MNKYILIKTAIWLLTAFVVLANIPYVSAATTYLAFLNLAASAVIAITIFVKPTLVVKAVVEEYRNTRVPHNYLYFLWIVGSAIYFYAGFPLAALASAFALIITITTIMPFAKQHA